LFLLPGLFSLCLQAKPKATPSSSTSWDHMIPSLGFSFGSLTEDPTRIQTSSTGDKELFQWNTSLAFEALVKPWKKSPWTFHPEIFWVLPQSAGRGATKNIFLLRTDARWRQNDLLAWRVGVSLATNYIKGKGGSTKAENGSGVSTFYNPSQNSFAYNTTFDVGAEFLFETLSLRLQSYWYSLTRSERRRIDYSLMLTFYYDRGLK
jgi:hypothetical protein